MGLRVALTCALVVAGPVAMCVHFSLNKYVNFRAHDRAVHLQAGTYIAVTAITMPMSLTLVEILVVRFGMIPIDAKVLSVIVLMPITFSAHRFLTFGPGIVARLRRALGAAGNR
jgi:putative flippase GtrA